MTLKEIGTKIWNIIKWLLLLIPTAILILLGIKKKKCNTQTKANEQLIIDNQQIHNAAKDCIETIDKTIVTNRNIIQNIDEYNSSVDEILNKAEGRIGTNKDILNKYKR